MFFRSLARLVLRKHIPTSNMLQRQKTRNLLVRVMVMCIRYKSNGQSKSTFSKKYKQQLQEIIKTLSNPIVLSTQSLNLAGYGFPKFDQNLTEEGSFDLRIYRPFSAFTYEPTGFGIRNLPTVDETSIRIFCGIQSLFNLDQQISGLIKPILDCESRGYGALASAAERELLIRLLSQKYVLMMYLSEPTVPYLNQNEPCCRLLDWEMSAASLAQTLFLWSFYEYEHIQHKKNSNIQRTSFLNYLFCRIISIMVPTIFYYLDELFWYFGFGFLGPEPDIRSPQEMYVRIAEKLEFLLDNFLEHKLGSTN